MRVRFTKRRNRLSERQELSVWSDGAKAGAMGSPTDDPRWAEYAALLNKHQSPPPAPLPAIVPPPPVQRPARRSLPWPWLTLGLGIVVGLTLRELLFAPGWWPLARDAVSTLQTAVVPAAAVLRPGEPRLAPEPRTPLRPLSALDRLSTRLVQPRSAGAVWGPLEPALPRWSGPMPPAAVDTTVDAPAPVVRPPAGTPRIVRPRPTPRPEGLQERARQQQLAGLRVMVRFGESNRALAEEAARRLRAAGVAEVMLEATVIDNDVASVRFFHQRDREGALRVHALLGALFPRLQALPPHAVYRGRLQPSPGFVEVAIDPL